MSINNLKIQPGKHNLKTQVLQINKDAKTTVDISYQPYDQFLDHLKSWRNRDTQTILQAMDDLYNYQYTCLVQHESILKRVMQFHKEISKQDDLPETEPKIQIDPILFAKIKQLKEKLKNMTKEGYFQTEINQKLRLQELKKKKINLVNAQIQVPKQLLMSQTEERKIKFISQLYKAFVTYFPEAHIDAITNQKTISFIKQLFASMKRRSKTFINTNQRFTSQVQKMCTKFRKQKYKENKKKMIQGQIPVVDVVLDKNQAFLDYSAQKALEQRLAIELKQSQIIPNRFQQLQLKQKKSSNKFKEEQEQETKNKKPQNLEANNLVSPDSRNQIIKGIKAIKTLEEKLSKPTSTKKKQQKKKL